MYGPKKAVLVPTEKTIHLRVAAIPVALRFLEARIVATIIGTELDDPNLTGTAGADTISGLGGRDHLYGGAGKDTLYRGAVTTPCTVMPAPTSGTTGPATTTTTVDDVNDVISETCLASTTAAMTGFTAPSAIP